MDVLASILGWHGPRAPMQSARGAFQRALLCTFALHLSAFRGQLASAQAVEMPVKYHVSYQAFDECGWMCPPGPQRCYSWEIIL